VCANRINDGSAPDAEFWEALFLPYLPLIRQAGQKDVHVLGL
jgi:hypothetical protein